MRDPRTQARDWRAEHLCIVILRTKRGYIQCTQRGLLSNWEIAEYRRMGYGVIVL